MQGNIKITLDLAPLKKLERQSLKAFDKAMEKGAIQFLTWANTGRGGAKSPRKPPIRWGILRGSSSAFVGSRLVQVFDQPIDAAANEQPTPARSHGADPTTMTFVWNTDYASKMHEYKGEGGPVTRRDPNAGGKWLEEHLKADREALMEFIGIMFSKEVGL